MIKMKVVIFCAMQMLAFGGLAYGWGLDALKPSTSTGGGVTKTDIDSYFNLSKKADDLQNGSINSLAKMLLNKESSAEIDRKMAAAKAIQDPKEREATMNKISADTQATIVKAANDKVAQQNLKNLSDDQKKQASGAISNLFLSALGNKSAVDVATGIVKKAQASPTSALSYANEMPKIKDGVAALPGKIEKTYTLANQLLKLAKNNKIEVTIPQSASDKPQEVAL